MKALGKYFTYNELTVTKSGLINVPNKEQEANLIKLVANILDPLRELYGKPIKVNSGFRSVAVNMAVNGANTSQHLKGMAVDLDCEDNKKLFELIRDYLTFDQLIDEQNYSWVHVSFNENKNRGEIWKMVNGHYKLIKNGHFPKKK